MRAVERYNIFHQGDRALSTLRVRARPDMVRHGRPGPQNGYERPSSFHHVPEEIRAIVR